MSSPRRTHSTSLAITLGLAAVGYAPAAHGDDAMPTRRIYGFGSAHGVSVGGATLYTAPGRVGAGTGMALLGFTAPTFELQMFAPELYSVDLSTSLTGTIFAAGFDDALHFTQDAYFTFHLGKGVARFVGGPGVGFTVVMHEDERGVQSGNSLRLLSQFGLELLTKNEAFGFKLVARPWLEFSRVQAFEENRTFVGGGFAHHFVFTGYLRK